MKYIRSTGILVFCFAFVLFIATLFLNNYKFDNEAISKLSLNQEQKELLKNISKPFIEKEYVSKYSILNDFDEVIEQVNIEILSNYQIDENELLRIIPLNEKYFGDSFKLSVIDSVFNLNSYNEFKALQLKSYLSWFSDKQIDENFTEHISSSALSINNSIQKLKGIDSYKLKELKYEIIKYSSFGMVENHRRLLVFLTFIVGLLGSLIYIIPLFWKGTPGIKNNNIYFNSLNKRGVIGIVIGSFLIAFYLLLYWFPYYITEWIYLVNPLSVFLNGHDASNWFLYGLLYSLAITVMGIRFLSKYRHNRYQQVRTFSVIFFQLSFAFIISNILGFLNLPEIDLKNIWPLDYSFFFEWRLKQYVESGTIGYFMLVWGISLFVLIVPLFTYLYGKRWYCSWVCGCGGLAETAGDSFRHLSDKSVKAWRIERYSIYSVLVFAVLMTVLVLYTFFTEKSVLLGINSYSVRMVYGFLISSIFAGVVGTGFYPLMGNRVWCRFGCPLAAYMGIIQRFKSRFRITTNGSQCISCGNCSTYCEMGIDVRWYAQRGQNIVRASCVGCGICSAVCPRGVLKLENGPEAYRIDPNPVF